MNEPTCPGCGSIDVCQEWLRTEPVREYGWACDRCGEEWDVEVEPGP